MFDETHEAVLVSERALDEQEAACRVEEAALKKQHGVPLWIRRGYTKNGSVTFAVSKKVLAPAGRTFPSSVDQSDWVQHVE